MNASFNLGHCSLIVVRPGVGPERKNDNNYNCVR